MTLSLLDTLKGGGGRIEYAMTIQGMPYILTSSDQLTDTIGASEELRQKLLGARTTIKQYADDAYVMTAIESVGAQRMRADPTKGVSSTPLSVQLFHDGIKRDWSRWFGDTHETGIPGISYALSQASHPTMRLGRLAIGVSRSETEWDVFDETGNLQTYLDSQITTYGEAFVWIDRECVVVDQTGTSAVDDAFGIDTATASNRGVFRSVMSSHTIDQASGSSGLIMSAPLGYVGGRYAYVYAIACDDDCSDLSEPAMIHCGVISDNIRNNEGMITLNVAGYVESLSTPIRSTATVLTMAGYLLTRPSDSPTFDTSSGYNPHIKILEYIGGAWQTKNIWLCAAGGSVYYKDLNSLLSAVDDELRKVSNGDTSQTSGDGSVTRPYVTTTNKFWLGVRGVTTDHNQTAHGTFPKVGGLLGTLCHLGATYEDGISINEARGQVANYLFNRCVGVRGTELLCWNEDETYDVLHIPITPTSQGSTYRDYCPTYIYMWGIEDGTEDTRPNAQETFPWPEYGGTSQSRVLFQANSDTAVLQDGAKITFGQTGDPWKKDPSVQSGVARNEVDPRSEDYNYADSVAVGWYALGSAGVDSSSGLPYIELGDTIYYKGSPRVGEDIAAIESVTGGGIAGQFGALTYHTFYHDKDPHAVHQGFDITTTDVVDLLRAMLGDPNATATISNDRKADWIAMAYDDDYDGYDSIIDWDVIGSTWRDIMSEEYYRLFSDNETEDFAKILQDLMISHGLSLVWEYDGSATPPMWRLRTKLITDVSASRARSEGAVLTDDDMISGATGEITWSGNYRYTDARLQCTYNGDEFLVDAYVDCKDAIAAMGGRRKTLKIESKMLQLPPRAGGSTDQRFIRDIYKVIHDGVLQPLALQKPAIRVIGAFQKALSIAPGKECYIEDSFVQNPYTGRQGFSGSCVCTELVIDWPNAKIAVTAELAGDTAQPGLAPAVYLAPGDAIRQSTTEVFVSPSINSLYTSGSRKDLSWFDCMEYLPDGTYKFTDCDCNDYAIILLEEDRNDSVPTAGTISLTDETADSATLIVGDTSDIEWESLYGEFSLATTNRVGGYIDYRSVLSNGDNHVLINEGNGGFYRYTSAGDDAKLYIETYTADPESWSYSALISGYLSDNLSPPWVIQRSSDRQVWFYYFADAGDPTYGSSRTVVESTDAFSNTGLPSSPMTALWCTTGGTVYGARAGTTGIYKATKTGGWTQLDGTWGSSDRCYAIHEFGGKLYFGKGRYISRMDSESSFVDIDVTGDSYWVTRMCTDGTYLWIGDYYGRIYTYDGSTVVLRHTITGNERISELTYNGGRVYASTYDTVTGTSEVKLVTTTYVIDITDFSSNFTGLTGEMQAHFHMDDTDYLIWSVQDTTTGVRVFYSTTETNKNPCALLYGDRDDANLQPCQEDYAYFADDDNQITDSAANSYPGTQVK